MKLSSISLKRTAAGLAASALLATGVGVAVLNNSSAFAGGVSPRACVVDTSTIADCFSTDLAPIIVDAAGAASDTDVFTSSMVSNITDITIAREPDITSFPVQNWGGIGELTNLNQIDASATAMTAVDLAALAATPVAGQIEILNLSGNPTITDYSSLSGFTKAVTPTPPPAIFELILMGNNPQNGYFPNSNWELPGVGTLSVDANTNLSAATYAKFPNLINGVQIQMGLQAQPDETVIRNSAPVKLPKIKVGPAGSEVALTDTDISNLSPAGGDVIIDLDNVVWPAPTAVGDATYSYEFSKKDGSITYTGVVQMDVHVKGATPQVTFQDASGTVAAQTIATKYDASGKIALDGTAPAAARDGYTFDGWFYADGSAFDSADVKASVDSATGDYQDVTVSAKWTEVVVPVDDDDTTTPSDDDTKTPVAEEKPAPQAPAAEKKPADPAPAPKPADPKPADPAAQNEAKGGESLASTGSDVMPFAVGAVALLALAGAGLAASRRLGNK
ncbi:hypothetical protein KIMH_14290 [Bombiscardovia apis]|uniref:Gram-positive cocci surface proteins LPxTG domain-containing protein n=1 Tax=Bombiscardovia apis TaxID=2932182 RepID=A0ABM8BEG3_9BIFI|nr:hypothetical protein [Bombiscardovia apis]BDR55318.1 hypothetical protein KIMH_14290 [Bombiscardovia apis]